MWFDPYKALSGIEAAPPATTAIIARNQAKKAYGLAEIADLAGVACPEQKTAPLVAPPPPLSAKPEPRPEIFKWSCPAYVPVPQLIYAAFRSKAMGLLPMRFRRFGVRLVLQVALRHAARGRLLSWGRGRAGALGKAQLVRASTLTRSYTRACEGRFLMESYMATIRAHQLIDGGAAVVTTAKGWIERWI